MSEITATEIIYFWFEEIPEENWWIKDDDFDQLLRERYLDLHTVAVDGGLAHWRETPEGRLAEIIVLDQFSRNMFRDTAKMFAADDLALMLAKEAVALGVDKELTVKQCIFLYVPYMHSEDTAAHDKAMELYKLEGLEENLKFEIKHKEIIDRFGRYPHRNVLLGRRSTPEEIEFLKQPGSSF